MSILDKLPRRERILWYQEVKRYQKTHRGFPRLIGKIRKGRRDLVYLLFVLRALRLKNVPETLKPIVTEEILLAAELLGNQLMKSGRLGSRDILHILREIKDKTEGSGDLGMIFSRITEEETPVIGSGAMIQLCSPTRNFGDDRIMRIEENMFFLVYFIGRPHA